MDLFVLWEVVGDGVWDGQRDDVEGLAVLVTRVCEYFPVFFENVVVGVSLWCADGEDGVGGDETCDVVHVAVGVVAFESGCHPDDVCCAEGCV